jgi:hypothetical protein
VRFVFRERACVKERERDPLSERSDFIFSPKTFLFRAFDDVTFEKRLCFCADEKKPRADV